MLDASHQISVGASGWGWTSRVAVAIAAFTSANASSCSGCHALSNSFWRLMFFNRVSDAILPDAWGTKRWKKAQIPKKRSNSFGVFGCGNRLMSSTRSGGIEIPCESTMWPRNLIDDRPSTHLSLFRRRPASFILWKIHLRSRMWSSLLQLPTITSSIYTKCANGRSLSSWCTFRWKHCAAFFNPYSMWRNL